MSSAFGAELERFPIGSDRAVTPGDTDPDGLLWFTSDAATGESATGSSSMSPGMYVVDCVTHADGESDHAWRAAKIEIVTP